MNNDLISLTLATGDEDSTEEEHWGYLITYENGAELEIPYTDLDVLPGVNLILAFSSAGDAHIEAGYNMTHIDRIEAIYR